MHTAIHRISRFRLALAVLAFGAASQVSQAVLVREMLMVFHGNEISIGIALAAWLLWGGLGSLLCGHGLRRVSNPLPAAALCAGGLLVLAPATVAFLRDARRWFDVVPGEALSLADALWVGVPAMGPACLLWGAQFVLLAQLWRSRYPAPGRPGAVRAYALEAAGNMLGGAAFSLLLVRRLDPLASGLLAGGLLVAALAALAMPRTRTRRALAVLLAAAAAAMPLLGRLEAWTHARHWQRLAPDQPLAAVARSRYGRIAIIRRGEQTAFYQSGNLVFSTAAPGAPARTMEEHESAVLAHLALAQHPAPRRVLLVGGTLRGVLREVLAHPVESVDAVEIDPDLVRAALPRLPASTRHALHDPRVRLHLADGRMLLKTSTDAYDVILVDVPDPATAALNRFYTREFFEDARRRLRPGGVLIIGAASVAGLHDPAAIDRNATLYHTLRQVFARVLPAGDRALLFFASDAEDRLSSDPNVLAARHRASGVEATGFSAHIFFSLLQETPQRRLFWRLSRHGRTGDGGGAPPEGPPLFPPSIAEQQAAEAGLPPVDARRFINSDLRPIGYFRTLVFWNRQVRGRHDPLLTAALRVRAWWILPLLGAMWLATRGRRGAGDRRHGGARRALRLAILSTGTATMATQVAILFTFQSQYGFVYEMIGLIAAVFMGGLAAGAVLVRATPHCWRRLAVLQGVIAAWACVMAVGLPAASRLQAPGAILALFAGMTLLAGLWNGMNFPLAMACAATLNRAGPEAVGATYGIELLGAALGAVLAGGVIIPVLGIAACCLFSAALNAAAWLAIVLQKSKPTRHPDAPVASPRESSA